jgi:hypothetical protein
LAVIQVPLVPGHDLAAREVTAAPFTFPNAKANASGDFGVWGRSDPFSDGASGHRAKAS